MKRNNSGKGAVLIRDGLYLQYGYFQIKNEFSHIEIERGYNIFGQPLSFERRIDSQYMVLCAADGITTFKSQSEMDKWLSQIGPYKMYCSDLIHRKFDVKTETLLELSKQDVL